jgi:hypothetical protein
VQVKPEDGFCPVPGHFGMPLIEIEDDESTVTSTVDILGNFRTANIGRRRKRCRWSAAPIGGR